MPGIGGAAGILPVKGTDDGWDEIIPGIGGAAGIVPVNGTRGG